MGQSKSMIRLKRWLAKAGDWLSAPSDPLNCVCPRCRSKDVIRILASAYIGHAMDNMAVCRSCRHQFSTIESDCFLAPFLEKR